MRNYSVGSLMTRPNMRSSELLRAVMPAAPRRATAQQSRQPSAVAELLA